MKTKDMTKGDPLSIIIWFAIPLFIGNIFQQVYTLVDTMIAGYNLGDPAIAAIGSTSSLYSLIMNIAWGLNGGYAIVVTQRFGSHDKERFKEATAAMLVLNVIGTVALTTISLVFLNPMMRFLETPESIYEQAYIYILIICAGMAATFTYNMFASFLRAVGNSTTPLYFLILSCVINLSMDVLFIMVLHMGVAGAALATVIAETASAVFCGIYILKKYRALLPQKKHFKIGKKMYMEMLSAGASMAMMQCVFAIGSVVLQRAINGLGDTIITAHTAARRIIEILMQPLSTIASATATFVGQNFGAGKMERIKKTLKQTLLLEIAWGVFAAILAFTAGRFMIRFMTGTTDLQVMENAVMNLKINFIFYPELGVLLCLRMAMQAMGQKVLPVISSSIELGVKVVSALFIIPVYGYVSASFTEPVTWIACMVFLSAAYLWIRKRIYGEEVLQSGEIHERERESCCKEIQ